MSSLNWERSGQAPVPANHSRGIDHVTGDPAVSAPNPADEQLARTYRRLLFCYPRSYRMRRAEELVGTYLETAGERRRPSLADAVDLFIGGIRERLRAAGLSGIATGLPIAATLALSTLCAISVYFLVSLEPSTQVAYPIDGPSPRKIGSLSTLAGPLYLGWLLAAALTALFPGRPARSAATLMFGLLLGVTALSLCPIGLTGLPLYVLLPLLALAALTLAQPLVASWPMRLSPIGTALATGAGIAATGGPRPISADGYFACCDYRYNAAAYAMHWAAVGLAVAAAAVALWCAHSRDARGAWALLPLATPLVLLECMQLYYVEPFFTIVAGVVDSNPTQIALTGLLAALVTGLLPPLLVAAWLRVVRSRPGATT